MKDISQVCLELLVRSVALEINQKHPASVTITMFFFPAKTVNEAVVVSKCFIKHMCFIVLYFHGHAFFLWKLLKSAFLCFIF